MVEQLSGAGQSVSVNDIRNKINEIIDGGLGGGGNISVSASPPPNAAEGDLWYDDTSAALYVYYESPISAWIQTNGNGGGGTALKLQTSDSSTLSGGIIIDHSGNKLRIYENGGSFRGAYLDLSQCFAYQGTDVLSSEGGAAGAINHTPGVQSFYADISDKDCFFPLPISYIGQERTFLITVAGTWSSNTVCSAFSGVSRTTSILNIRPGMNISGGTNFPVSVSSMNEQGVLQVQSTPFIFNKDAAGSRIYTTFLLWNCPATAFSLNRGSSTTMQSITVTDLGSGATAFNPPAGFTAEAYNYFYIVSYE
jgi:hypothetical protein